MSEGWRIRLAAPEDETAVRETAESAFQQYVDAIGRPPAPMVADFRAEIAKSRVHVVTDLDGRVAGLIIFFVAGGVMHLDNIAVRPAFGGQGLGKRLIAHCEAEARRLSAVKIALFTNAKMTENLSIYPHLGFREVDRRREDGFDRVFFEKSLV